jgi:hypothetical protein
MVRVVKAVRYKNLATLKEINMIIVSTVSVVRTFLLREEWVKGKVVLVLN